MAAPIFLSCAEIDSRFPNDFRNRAVDIMQAEKKKFQLQLFQGVEHGFAVRGSDSDPYASMYRPGIVNGPMFNPVQDIPKDKAFEVLSTSSTSG